MMRRTATAPEIQVLVPVSQAVRVHTSGLQHRRAPTPLLPAIRALSRAGDNDTDDSRALQQRRMGLNSRDLSSLGLRPSTGLHMQDLGLRSCVSEGSLPKTIANHQSLGSRAGPPASWKWGTPSSPSGSCSRSSTARQKKMSRKYTSAPMMGGISSPAEIENDRVVHFEKLYAQSGVLAQGDNVTTSMTSHGVLWPSSTSSKKTEVSQMTFTSSFNGKPLMVEQDFLAQADEIKKKFEDLRQLQDGFDPVQIGKSQLLRGKSGGLGSTQRRVTEVADEDEHETKQDRLDAYKMCKKIEEPLPKLTPDGVSARAVLQQMRAADPPPDLHVVDYNMSEEAILQWTPRARKQWIEGRRARSNNRMAEVLSLRDHLIESSVNVWSENLQRKKERAEFRILQKKTEGARMAKMQLDLGIQRWLVVVSICGFLRTSKEEVDMSKLPTTERMQYLNTLGTPAKARHRQSVFLQEALMLHGVMHQEKASRSFQMLATIWSCRTTVKRKKTKCSVMIQCLTKWKSAYVFLTLRGYLKQVRAVQAWWRATRQKLREVRDHMSKRWEWLERDEVAHRLREHREQVVETARPAAKLFAHRKSYILHHEEKLEAEITRNMIPEVKRLRFVENELRARRYNLLPAIQVYEDDLQSWRENERNRRKFKQKLSSFFQMPPSAPSYLPAPHLSAGEGVNLGKPCQHCEKWCPGERGDKEISRWIRLLTESPKAKSCTEITQHKQHRADNAGTDAENDAGEAQQSSLFGNAVGDEDLKQYGIDPQFMPGLIGGRLEEIRGPNEGHR